MPINPYEPPKGEPEPPAKKSPSRRDLRIIVLGVATFLSLSYLGVVVVGSFIQPSPVGLAPVLIGVLLNVPVAIWWWIYHSNR